MEENKKQNNGRHIYVVVSMMVLIVIGGVIVASQNIGNIGEYFQGALQRPVASTAPTKTLTTKTTIDSSATVTLESLNKEVQELKETVASHERQLNQLARAVCSTEAIRAVYGDSDLTQCSELILTDLVLNQ